MSRVLMCVGLLIVVRPAAAQAELKWKWRAGETFYVRTVTKIKQTLVIEDPRGDTVKAPWTLRGPACAAALAAGQPLAVSLTLVPRGTERDREIRQSYEHTSWIRYTVKTRNDDGSAVLLQRVEPDRGTVKGEETFRPDPSLDGIELTLHADAGGQVTKVEGAETLLQRLTGDDTARRKALEEMLSPETLRGMAAQSLAVLPGSKKKPGETWNVSGELKLGALGRVKFKRVFTLDAVEDRGATSLARLSFTSRLTDYLPGRGDGIAFQIADGYLTEASGTGTAEIDLDAGRPLGGASTVKLAGYLTLRNADVFYRVRLAQDQTVSIKVMDKLPAKEEPKK